MSTRTQKNVQNRPQAQNVPCAAAANGQRVNPPSAAPPMPAPLTPGSVTRHNKNAAIPVTRHCAAPAPSLFTFAGHIRPKKVHLRIPSRESIPISCHKKNQEKLFYSAFLYKLVHSIPYRYPISAVSQPVWATPGLFFGHMWKEVGSILAQTRAITDKEKTSAIGYDPDFDERRRRNDPQRAPLLAQKTGRPHPHRRRGPGGGPRQVHCERRPFQREPDFGVTSVNYSFAELMARAGEPA